MSKYCYKSRQVIAQWREFPHPWFNWDICNYGVSTVPAYVQNLTTKFNTKKPLPLSSSALTLNMCLWQWKLYMQRERRINNPPSHLRTHASTSTSSPTQQPLSPPHLPPELLGQRSLLFPLPQFVFQENPYSGGITTAGKQEEELQDEMVCLKLFDSSQVSSAGNKSHHGATDHCCNSSTAKVSQVPPHTWQLLVLHSHMHHGILIWKK